MELEIPPGIQPGKVLRLKNRGIKHLNANGRGDQLVRVDVYIPEKLTADERELFESMKELENIHPPAREGKSFFQKVKDAFFGDQ